LNQEAHRIATGSADMKSFFRALSIVSILFCSGAALGESAIFAEYKKAFDEYQLLSKANKWSESLPHAKKLYELSRIINPKKPAHVAVMALTYGDNLEKTGHYSEAAGLYTESLTIEETVSGMESRILIPTLVRLGRTLLRIAREQESQQYYHRAIQLAEQKHGPKSLEFAKFYLDIADDMLESDPQTSKKYLRRSHDILKKERGKSDPMTGAVAFKRARYFMAVGDYETAKDLLLEALDSADNPDKPDNSNEMVTHGFLVEVYERLGESKEATRHCLAIGRMTPVADNQSYFPVYRADPVYPHAAEDGAIEGHVIVEFTVNSSGFVNDLKIVESSNEIFNETSLEAAKKFRYAPKFVEGKPVSTDGVRTKIVYLMAK
jgi:TonB family protein